MAHRKSANDKDGLLLIEADSSTFLDPEALDEITSGLRIGRKIFIASAASPAHATRFLARGYSIVVSRNGLADALPEVAARLESARRVFASPGIAAGIAPRLRDDQKISALAHSRQKLPAEIRERLSSTLFLDNVSFNLPQALHS